MYGHCPKCNGTLVTPLLDVTYKCSCGNRFVYTKGQAREELFERHFEKAKEQAVRKQEETKGQE